MNRETWLGVSFPYLKELEKKVGRKTPESFLLWMRDDVEADDHNSHFGQSFTDRLRNLKQDVRWVRSADVRILRQLAAVHEGIESARWFLSESSALDGGPTASGRAREPGVSLSKDVPRLTYPEDLSAILGPRSCVEPSSRPANRLLHEDFRDSRSQHREASRDLRLGSDSVKAERQNAEEDEETAALLFDYDARWCWIESRDDVTFL
ncbi:leucine rich adaptor protein 1-like isoform X2 [Syngnathoides biaculeatus]|uniref:leucine rich adaptor protein 1-like isoform X2 n=1 Tax=Syngnathoides biaculeatus TaxID=300417 RepID=UPI002ADE1452|nr:leucine rich adaptor protein 1-like isoform X2 [Syngnathoides biaculeatus]